jgi:hypothetical protein
MVAVFGPGDEFSGCREPSRHRHPRAATITVTGEPGDVALVDRSMTRS